MYSMFFGQTYNKASSGNYENEYHQSREAFGAHVCQKLYVSIRTKNILYLFLFWAHLSFLVHMTYTQGLAKGGGGSCDAFAPTLSAPPR